MKKFTIVFCETNTSLLSDCIEFFKNDEEIELLPYSGEQKVLVSNTVNGFIADVDFPLLRETMTSFKERGAKVILLSRFPKTSFEDNLPYDAVLYKPYSFAEIRDTMIKLILQQMLIVKLGGNKVIDEKLSNIFIRAGIPPHIKGYQFLREAVKLAVTQPDMINAITKKLYPSIARLYDTTPSKVERAIRHAIEVAWNRGKIENINAIFGIKIYGKGEKPTNGELIALVADKIMIESV